MTHDEMTLDEWGAQFDGIQQKTRELWKAIRWEFEQQKPPMTVRQMFYRMSSGSYVDKTEAGYRQVQRCLLNMRRARAIPYHWIADNTRWVRKQASYRSMQEALTAWQENYRRDLWNDQNAHVEIWLEKDALAGVFYEITNEYDVPLYVTRGYSSETYLFEAAEGLKTIDKPKYIYHFGDFDPSGRDAARDIAARLRSFGAFFSFDEAAVTEWQISHFQLPTRPTKKSDVRTKNWNRGDSVELDAIPPSDLRALVRSCIESHINTDQLAMTHLIEDQERERIIELSNSFGTSPKTA